MRILLDHCIDWRFARYFPKHDVKSAAQMGWAELRNGNLLSAAAGHFDVLLTVDRNLQYQQNPALLPISVLVLFAKTNRLQDVVPLVAGIEANLAKLQTRTIIEVR